MRPDYLLACTMLPCTMLPCTMLACTMLAGCFAPAIPSDWAQAAAGLHRVAETENSVAARLLSGFDPADASGLQQGDRALFHITLQEGEARTGEWWLRLTAEEVALEAPETEAILWMEHDDGSRTPVLMRGLGDGFTDAAPESAVLVEVFDHSGELLGSRVEHISTWHLATGFVDACEASAGRDVPRDTEPGREQDDARIALFAFLGVIRNNEQLADILWRILRAPSLWSIITHFGVRIRVAPEFEAATPASTLVDGQPANAWNLPVQILANGSPTLLCSMQVVGPRSPRALCAGVVSMVVVRPGDPGTYLTMQLMSARRAR